MSILPFRTPASKFRPCNGCRIPFRPAQPAHALCGKCYRAARWAAAFKVQCALWRELVDDRGERRP